MKTWGLFGLAAWLVLAVGLNVAGLVFHSGWLSWAGVVAWWPAVVMAVRLAVRHEQTRQREQMLTRQLTTQAAELERQAARLTALSEIACCLSGPLRLNEVLWHGAERVKHVLDADAVHVRLLNEESQSLHLETAVGAPVAFLTDEATLGMGECICGQVARSAQPLLVTGLGSDPRVTRLTCQQHGYCTVISVPLRSQHRVVGVLTAHSRASAWGDPADMQLLTAIGNQLGVAIENAQLYGDMEKRVQQLTRRMEHMTIVQERERISREIHDGVAQALALLNLRIGMANNLLVAGQYEQVRKELAEAAQVVDAANHDVREAITALRLTSPKGAEFVSTLKEFVLDFGVRNNISTELTTLNGTGTVMLAPLVEVQLMRIIQESLTNVRKHAHAQRAWVTLAKHRQQLRVTVQDDGHGFDMDAVLRGQNRKNFGITTMHERAESIGGTLDIATGLGWGTRVTVTVPIEMKE